MTRLYWEIVKHIYVVLVWTKYVAKVQTDVLYNETLQWWKQENCLEKNVYHALHNVFQARNPSIPFDEVLDNLTQKILQMKNMKYEGDLIDTIVGLLQMPFHANTISGAGLKKLRRALLLPDEAQGLTDRINKAEMACQSCGHEIEQGEAVVLMPNGAGTNAILCFACAQPLTCSCQNCGTSIPFLERFTQKRTSKDCNHKKKEPSPLEVGGLNRPVVDMRSGRPGGNLRIRPADLRPNPGAQAQMWRGLEAIPEGAVGGIIRAELPNYPADAIPPDYPGPQVAQGNGPQVNEPMRFAGGIEQMAAQLRAERQQRVGANGPFDNIVNEQAPFGGAEVAGPMPVRPGNAFERPNDIFDYPRLAQEYRAEFGQPVVGPIDNIVPQVEVDVEGPYEPASNVPEFYDDDDDFDDGGHGVD